MDVDNITDVAERVHPEFIGGIPRSGLSWFQRVVEFPLYSCAPAVSSTLGPWTTQFGSNARHRPPKTKEHFDFECATRIFLLISICTRLHGELPSCLPSWLRGMNGQLWQVVWNISCLRWYRRLTLQHRDFKFGLPTWNKPRNETVQWHVPKQNRNVYPKKVSKLCDRTTYVINCRKWRYMT